MKTSIYFTYYIKMSKQFYFLKKVVQGGLANDTFLTLWDLLESWTSQNNWMAIFFIIFLGVVFEIVLLKICTAFQKKPAPPSEKHNSDTLKKDSCLKIMKVDNWSVHSSSEERVDDFSERTVTSSLTSEGNEGNFGDRAPSPDEPTWESTSESKYRVSHFSESHMTSSDGTSSSVSLFQSEVQEVFLKRRGCPEIEHKTIQFSSKKLFSIMKTKQNKNVMFSSDFNFSRTSRIITESEDLDVAPCPPAHLFLSRDQVRLLEESVRNQIPLKSKATLESKTAHLYSRSQEPLIQNQHFVRMDISAEAQDSSPGQNDIQNQGFSEAQFTSQAPRFANNQEAITSQPDIEARDFALPQDLMRKPLSSRIQDPFQTQDVDRSQHLVQVPHFVETQDSIKDLESDAKHSNEAQYSFWFEDSNKVKNSVPGQNTVLNNAGHLAFTLSPNSVAKVMPQHKSIRTKGQKQIASSKLNQYPAYGSVPLPPTMTRQKNRRKTIHTKSKLSLKVPSQKSNKTPTSRVFQITVCHTSEHSKLRHKCKTKKKELHQRKGISGIALRLIYVFKLVPPSIRKYSRKRLVKSMPGLTGCRHFLLKQNKSLYAEKLNYTESVEKRGTSGSTKNKKQLGRDNKELENISPKIPPQLEESFMVNTYQRKAPCSSLIDTNWKSKESLKEPIIQAKEMDISEFCAPNSEKTFDLHIAKHDTPLEEAISEPLQRLVSSPKMESDRRMKTWEDLKSTEKSHLPLSRGEKLPTSTSDMQRCFPKGNTQKKEDFLEIVLEPADINLFISLGTKKHTSSEQSASVEIQESPEGVIEKKKKPLIVDVIEDGDLSGSEKLECNTRSSIKNRRDERTSDAFHDVTHTALSEPPLMEMKSGLKTKTDTSGIGLSHSAIKPDELPDDKKPWSAEYIKKRCIFKKPQEHDREEEQQALREAVPQLTPGFRFSLKLKQKPKYVKVEIGQSSSESRTTQDKELEVQPQALSIETVVGTSPLPTVDPFQVEKVKQSTDRPTGSETADPTHPLIVSESLPVGKILTETTGHGVPLGGSPGKPLGGQIAEEKEDLKRILPEVALGSFHRYTIPLSNVKKQKIRKKLPGTQNVLGLKSVIMKVRKSPVHRRRRLRGDFKIMIKQILQDKTVTDMLLNVIDPHVSILPHIRTHSRFNAGNQGCTKLKQEIAEVEREEEFSDTISKGSDSGNTLEAAKLQDEVRGDQEASPEAVLEDGWNLRLDACTEKELKTEKEMQQPIISAEVMMESFYSAIMEPFHVENMKKSRTTPADLRCTADSKMPPPASEKSLIEDPLNQTRESAVPGYGSDTGEMGYSFTETKAELPKDLPAISPETFNCHMPVLSHPKEVKKNRVRFSHLECRVKSKSVHMKASKPSISQICNITGHRKKLESDFKAKFEKINQANGLLYEFLNTLYSPVHSRLQGETHSFYHAQVNLQVPAGEGRPQYVDFFDKGSAFYDREEKVQDGEEEEQKTLQITAPQPTQYLWMDGCQGKETHLAKPDPALDRLTQEQGIQHQTCFTQTALQTGLQMGPREAKGFQKTTKPEDDGTAPTGLEIPPPKAGNSSLDKLLNTATECGLPSGGNLKRELDSYFVGKNSELPENLQVTFLQSSDSVNPFVSKSKRKKNMLKIARKQKTVSHRYRTTREEKPSILHMLNGRQSGARQCSLKTKTKNPQQSKNRADASLDITHFKVPTLPNIKMSVGLNIETDTQRLRRLSDMQQVQGKSPNGRKVCCPDSIHMSSLCNSVKDGEETGEQEDLPTPENRQGFIFNMYQKKDHDLVKSDEELKQPGSINIRVQPPTHFAQTVLSSASYSALDQMQLRKLESYARFSPPVSGEAKIDEQMFSARECGVPCDVNHWKEPAGGIERKETVTSDFCMTALSISKSKRNFKQYSDMKTLMNPRCGILKAKKPSISHMLNIKGCASPYHRKELRYNLTPKMKEVDPGKKMADNRYSLTTAIPAVNRYSKREREKNMLGEKRFSSKQVKPEASPHEGTVTPDDTEDADLQDEEGKESDQEMLLKIIPQHSQHFIFCSGQRNELDLHKTANKGRGKMLFVTEQDIPQQTPPPGPTQAEGPERSQQTQDVTVWSESSALPLLKSKESPTGLVLSNKMNCPVPSDASHTGGLYDCGKEGKAELREDLQAAVLEFLDASTPDLSECKRQRKTCICRDLRSKMSPKCVMMKARKAPISQIFNIPGNGRLKTLPPKTLKSQLVDFVFQIKYSGVLEDLTAEGRKGVAQELPAAIPEVLDLSTLALPVSERNRNNSKLRDKRNKMSPKCVTLKAKKTPVSKTFNITKRSAPSHSRQFECKFKTTKKQGQSVAAVTLNGISSPGLVSLDMIVHNRSKVETDMPWKTRFSHELQLQGQWPDGERAQYPNSRGKRGRASNVRKEVKDHGGEAAPWNSQYLTFHAHNMKEPCFVKSDLEQKYSARKKIPESLTIAQELQQHTLFTQSVLHSVSCSILNSLPFEKLPKRTKIQSAKILSPMTRKSLSESLIVKAPSDILSERGPMEELASSIPEGKIGLQKDLQVRTLQSFGISMPASPEIKGLRNAALIPKSRTGKAQMASILKTTNIPRSGAPRHGKEWVYTLEEMAKEISQSMSNTFMNTFFSPTPVSPAIKTHKKLKAKKGPLRKKVNITQLKQEKGKRLCKYTSNKWSTPSYTSESRWQNEKEKEGKEVSFEAGLQFLNRAGSRKDQNMLTTEQEVQQQTLVSENILESVCSPLITPFQTEKLKKNIPPQTDILHRISEKISCLEKGKAIFDGFLIGGAEYRTPSDCSPTGKLDVSTVASLQLEEEEEDIKTRKVTKYTVDHNIPSPKSRISVLGIPYNESSRRKVGGRISKKHKELPRDLLTISMMSALSESKRQKKALKFPGRKDLMGPKRIIKKAKKPLFSQVLNITEDGHLYCRKEQECHLKSMIQDMQPNRSIADTFLSPTPVSTDNEIDIEIDSTPKTGADQPRVKIHNHTYPELEKAPSDGEAQEANLTDTQSRPSSTGKMNVPHEEGEENIPKMLAASIPHYSQHFCSSSHHMKNLGPCQSKSKLNSSEGRKIWNSSCALQNMRQEEHVREAISEHVSRNVMNFIQVQTLKKSLHSQEGIQYMVGLKTSFPKARKSETCFTQCNGLWDGNPMRKWGSPISKKKAWRQSDLVRTVLKPLDFSSLDSSEPKSQSYVLEVVDKKSTTCRKQVPLKAEKLPILQVCNSTRCLTGSCRKKNHKFKYKTRGRQWNEIVRETLLRPTEGAKIPPSQLVIDNLSLNTAARSTLYNNRTLHKNLGGLITEQKAESEEDLAPALLGPLDLFVPVLSDSESQINTVQEKTILNLKCFAMKKKEPFSLQIVKINKQFATKQRTKLRSNLETKMKEIWQGKSVADIFTNVNMPIYFASDTSDTKRQSRLKTEIDRVSRFSPLQPTYMKLPVEGRVILQSLNAAGHAALSISKGQEQETEREKTVLNADLKSTDASASIPLHIRMEQSPSTWGKYGESSEKRNALNKAKLTEKEEYEQQVLSGTPPQYTQPCGFLQKKQQEPCVSGTTQNPAYAYSPKCPKIIKRKANATAASVKKTTHTEQVKSKAEKPPVSLMGNTTEYGTQSKAKEMRCNIKKQKPGVQHGKAEAELVLKTVCDSGSVPSQIQGLMEAEREKGKSQRLTHIPPQPKLEKSRNRRQIAFSPSMAKSAKSRNIKTVKQYIREQEKNYQIASPDVLPQCRYCFVLSQQLKKEPDHVKSTVDLKREVYPDSPSQKKETNCTRFDISRIRLHTKHKFLIAPGVKEGDGDTAQRPFSTPQWRETSKKMNFSFISKGQDMFLPELDASQQKTCKKQELLKQGSISGTHLEPTLYPIMESPYLENTGKVSEEDTCVDRKNISHLLAREGLRETDILRGSNEQTFLCRSGEPLHVKEGVNATGKENVNISIVSSVNPWRKEKPKLTDIQLKSNGQKINFSKKWRAKQRNSCNQKKENLLETISSCIVLQLYTEKQKKDVSALSSTVLRLMVENASHKAGQLPCPEGINLHIGGRKEQQENTCKALPTSVSHSLMDILQIKLPRVTKALKEVDSPTYHTSNTEGIGLPIAGREEEQPECMQHICPNLASDPSRDIFQSKMPCKKKASEEVVSTVDYTPSAEGTGSLITGKGDQQEKCMYEVLRKSASHSQAGPCRIDTPVQEVKIGGKNKMNCEYSAPQAKEALKGMDVIVGYIPKNEKRRNLPSTEQSQQHLLIPSENLLEHTSYPPNEPWLPTHVMPPTKEALSEVGNVSSRTKELDLISKDHLNTGCGYGLEWTVPSVPPRQMTKQNTSPPLESFGKTVKYQNVSLPKGKKLDGAQVIDSVSNVSSPKLRVRKKVQLHKTCQKNVHKEVYLPGLFSHSLSIHMTLLPENKRQKNDLKQGAKKVIIGPQRTSEKLVFSNIFNITDYGSPGSRPELQWSIREKMVNIKHRKVKPHVVVRNICEFIPSLPYLKLNKKTTDEIISNNVKGIKQPISQKKGDRIKGVNMKGIMDPNVIMKAKITSLSHILIEQELPGLLNITKQESKVQINKGKSGVKLTNLFTSLPSLSHPDLNSRTKAGSDESGTPWNCLPPLKIQTSSNIRKTSFAESIDRDSLSNIIESKQHLPQKKKEDGDNMVYMKNIRGSKCAPFERKKKLLKYTLHRNKPQWDNKEQEKMIQDDNSDIDVVQNKPHVSIPSSPHLEQGPGIKEQAYMRGVSRFCLPPLTLQELSDAVITREEPTDDILSSIKRSKYMPQENEDKVEMALEEIRYPKRIALEANQSPVARELQLNIKEKEEKMQADKDEQVGIQRKSCVSISLPPYSEADIRREGEAVMLRKPRSSFLQPKFQESSGMGNIAYKKPVYGNISNSLKKAKEHIMQEEEGRVKMAKVVTLEKKKSPISQEIQDIKEQKKKIQRIQGEPSVVLTCASIPATSFKLDTRIKEADYRNEVTRYSLPELSHQKSSDVVKNANKESIEGDITSAVQAANEHMPQEGKARGKIANMKYIMYFEGTTSKAKVLPLLHVPNALGRCSPQIREVQTHRREDLGHVRERSELDEVLIGPCLHHFTLNKVIEGKREQQGIMKPCIPSSWYRESSNAEKLKYTVSPVNDTSSDSRRTKYMTQKEEEKASIFVRDLMHPKCLALKAKKSSLFHILKANKLQVNIKEQVRRGQEGRRDTVVLLSKICPFVTPSVHLKFDTITEEGGPGIIRNHVPSPELQDSLPSGRSAPPKSTGSHRKRGKQHPALKEKDRVQTAAVSSSVRYSGTDFKAKTSSPPHVASVAEYGALSKRKEVRLSAEESVEQGQGRTGDLDGAPAKPPPSPPSPSHHRLDAGTKGGEDLPTVAGFSPSPFQLPESSGARKIRHAHSSQGISSGNIIIKGYTPYKETKVRVKTKDVRDRLYPKIITLEAHTSLTHLLSRNRLPLNVKEQGQEVQDGKGEPEMALRETRASLLSPSYLKRDTSRNEKKDTERITRSCFPPLKIYDPFNPSTKADAKSFDGYLIKDKDRLKTDIEDKVLPREKADTRSCAGYMSKEKARLKTDTKDKVPPISMNPKANELPLSHIHDTKELPWKIKEQKRKVQREESELVTKLKNICTSLLTLPYLKSDTTGEGYMIRITKLPFPQAQSKESSEYAETNDGELSKDVKKLKEHMLHKEKKERERNMDMNSRVDPNNMDLEAKKSPILFTSNLSDLQWKTKGQEEKVQEDKQEPGDATLTETCTSTSSPLPLDENTSIREEGQHLPQNKEEDGVERGNLMSPKHQGKEMQDSKDGPGMVLTKSSISSPSLSAPKLDKGVQVNDEMLALKRSVLTRISNAGQMVCTYSVSGDTMKDVQNEKEERDTVKTVDRRGVAHSKGITLKSKKSPSSYVLHRTELHLNVGGIEQKKQESQGKPPGTVVRKIYVSKPPTKLKLDKGTQVDEGKLGIKKPSLLPRMLSALSDAKKRPDTKGIGGDVIKRKQHMSEKEKKYDVKEVDMRLRTHLKEATISPILHILSAKEFVLNVIKEPGGKVRRGKDEPRMVPTRTFLSIPSAPLYLDSGSKIDKDAPGIMGSSHPQQNLQESLDTQKTAVRKSAAGQHEIVKNAEHPEPKEAMQQWTSNFMLSVQRRKEAPRVKSEGDLSQFFSNSQPEDFYFTGFGTIRSGKRLECLFTGPEAHQEKYKPETFTTVLSFPMMDLTKIENLKKEMEIMNNLNHKISPQVLVSVPRKLSKDIYATLSSPISSEGFSTPEQGAYQQETLSKATPGSEDPCKFDKPEEDRRDNEKISEMSPPKVLAPQTKESLEKMNITESNDPQNTEQEIVMKKQVVLRSGSGQKTRVDSSLSLKIPLQNVKQRTPLETGVHKQTTVYPGIQILPAIHMDITEFDAQKGKKEQTLLVPEQEGHSLESLQKSISSRWAFPLQSGDLEEKNKTDTGSARNLEQKILEMKERVLKIDTNIAVHLEEDKIEMHKHIVVNLEKETIKMDTINTVNLNMTSLKAEEPQMKSQVITHTANSCPVKQKHKKEREASGAKQTIQLQKMFQKHVLDSFYAYIPLSPKFGGQKGRLTIADLKRELNTKCLNMETPKHPVLQILGNTGHGTPSNRKKLEYNFNRPKKIALWREGASGIFIRSLSIAMMSLSQTKETVKSETNLERAKRTHLSKFQKKPTDTSETVKTDSCSTVKEGDQNFTNTVPRDSQPFVADKQQMHQLPSIKSEANLSSEMIKNLAPQTKESIVPGDAISRTVKETDLLMIEQEEVPKPIQTPTECPLVSEDPKENVETHMKSALNMGSSPPGVEEPQDETQPLDTVECASPPEHRSQSEPVQDTAIQEVEKQKASPGTVSIPPRVKSNELKIVADSPSAESLLPLYEAIKNVFVSQVKNTIKFFPTIPEKVKDDKRDDWKSPPLAGGPDTTSMTIHPKLQPKPILENFTCKEKVKLTNHLESKAPEIKLNSIPEVVKQSFQKFSFYQKLAISRHNSWKLYPRHKNMFFLSLEGIDTIEFKLKLKYQKDSPPVSSMNSLIVNVSRGSEEIITKLKSISVLESGTSSLTSARERTLPHILQNYSVGGKNKLLIHFSVKTLEIQMKAFPRIVRESYTMASAQDGRKLLSKCIHSGVKAPKRKNRVFLLFEEKSLHQIDLDLQYKYLRFLLGSSVESMFPQPNAFPKHVLKLQTVAICKKVDDRGESGGLSINTEPLEEHLSLKEESFHENSSLVRNFLEPTQVCASDPNQHNIVQKDTVALSKLQSPVTPKKDKQCHVWFQETNTCESVDLKTQEKAQELVDSHSIQNSEDFPDSQTNTESSDNVEECSEVHESEECMFLDANLYLSQKSQNILFELQKDMPLENLCKKKKIETDLKPLYREDSDSHHIRGCPKHSLVVTPSSYESHKSRKHRSSSKMTSLSYEPHKSRGRRLSSKMTPPPYESHKSREYRSSSKMRPPDSWYHSSSNTIEVSSISSSIPFSEEQLSQTTRSGKSYSLVPLMESNIKLHLAKSQGKPHRHLESKERKKAKSDLFRKNNTVERDDSYTQSKEKHTRKKKVKDYESERSDYFPSKHKSASKPHQEDINFHSERKQNQPFFYACIPADSLEIMPQTIRWTIPLNTLRKKNFRVPLVAKISSSYNIWSSSKKLLGSLLESFSRVHQK